MAKLKLRNEDNTFSEVATKEYVDNNFAQIIDVESLPVVADTWLNKIVRYQGQLYVLAEAVQYRNLVDGENVSGKTISIDWPNFLNDKTYQPTNSYVIFNAVDADAEAWCYLEVTAGDADGDYFFVYYHDTAASSSRIIAYYDNDVGMAPMGLKYQTTTELIIPNTAQYIMQGISESASQLLLSALSIKEIKLTWVPISDMGDEPEYGHFYVHNGTGTTIFLHYKYEVGMTWDEFINSDYNTQGDFWWDGEYYLYWKNNKALSELPRQVANAPVMPGIYTAVSGGVPAPS